jgi:hypothetical protein
MKIGWHKVGIPGNFTYDHDTIGRAITWCEATFGDWAVSVWRCELLTGEFFFAHEKDAAEFEKHWGLVSQKGV